MLQDIFSLYRHAIEEAKCPSSSNDLHHVKMRRASLEFSHLCMTIKQLTMSYCIAVIKQVFRLFVRLKPLLFIEMLNVFKLYTISKNYKENGNYVRVSVVKA